MFTHKGISLKCDPMHYFVNFYHEMLTVLVVYKSDLIG